MKHLLSFSLRHGMALSLALISGMAAFGAPVDVEQALGEAAEFLRTPMQGRRAVKGATPAMTLAYTGKSAGMDCFYIFNYDSGYVIISADTRLPEVLGYSDSGMFDPDNIPDNMKWWLGEYSREITAFLPTASEEWSASRKTVARASAQRAPIAPMTTTKWNQDEPYNNLCPIDRQTGERSVTGCVATAMAQVLKYHNWPDQPEGSAGGQVLDGTTYRWSDMLDVYEAGKYSAAQSQAVAVLMRQCGAAVNMMYSSYASGAYDNNVQVALRKNFKYNNGLRMEWKDYTPLSKWQDMVYAELAAGRPLYYSGSSSYGGHAFVCDGYSENNYFHFNWGWGGFQDGYFLLTALNPATGGAGSYEGGYNSGQIIMTGVYPDKSGSTGKQQVALLSTGGFVWTSGEKFGISPDANGFQLIYNPMAYAETLQIALKVESLTDENFKPSYLKCGGKSTFQSLYGTGELAASFPTLADGTYSVTPVFAEGTDDWQPVLIPLGKQNYVRLTVNKGQKTFENVGPDDSNTPRLISGTPYSVTENLYGNAPLAFRVPIINVGRGDYLGRISISLLDGQDDFGDAISAYFDTGIAGESCSFVELVSQTHLSPGKYDVYVLNEAGDVLNEPLTMTVKYGNFPDIDSSGVTISSISPNFITSGGDYAIAFDAQNTTLYARDIHYQFALLDARTLEKVRTLNINQSVTVPANAQGRASSEAVTLDIEPGMYYWYMVDSEGKVLSECTPLMVQSAPITSGGFTYVITDEKAKEATLCLQASGSYEGNVTVPATIDGYKITRIHNDAFTFGSTPEVTLPAAIDVVPTCLFYSNKALQSLTLLSEKVAVCEHDAFAPDAPAGIWLNVPDVSAPLYHASEAWAPFQMTAWTFELEGGVEVTGGFPGNSSPYFVNALSRHNVTFSAPGEMNVEYVVTLNGKEILNNVLDPKAGTTLALPAMGLKGQGTVKASATTKPAGITSIAEDFGPADVYGIDGRLILRGADREAILTLTPGVYIISGRKVMITR